MTGQRAVIDFDFRGPGYVERWVESARERVTSCPVAWTEAYGGHWVVSGYEYVKAVLEDWETFSSDNRNPDKPLCKGILIPPSPHRLSLSESDPPVHGPLRLTEAPFFAPRAIREWEEIAAQRTEEVLDTVIEAGSAEFIRDVATPIPAMTTMQLAGVPLDHWREFALSAHEMSFRSSEDPLYPFEEIRFVQGKLIELLHDRRATPRQDVISAIANRVVDGKPIGDEVGLGMLNAFIFGGFDTATTALANALIWLEGKQELYPRLLDDDALMRNAVEELLRVYPSNHGIARTATRDAELGGQRIKAGDRVYLSWAAANRDPAQFDDPDEVRLDRPNAAMHMSFSGGVHKCLGAPLARMEIRVVLRAIMRRIPDYRI
ncbi:MAG: cytochrome P450, partial [Novosphingobium sp.]|nr:cytochrome P450 [Novosphingobium sp.]